MRVVNVIAVIDSLSHGTKQETKTVEQYDNIQEALEDLGEKKLLKLLNSKIISVVRGQLHEKLRRASVYKRRKK